MSYVFIHEDLAPRAVILNPHGKPPTIFLTILVVLLLLQAYRYPNELSGERKVAKFSITSRRIASCAIMTFLGTLYLIETSNLQVDYGGPLGDGCLIPIISKRSQVLLLDMLVH